MHRAVPVRLPADGSGLTSAQPPRRILVVGPDSYLGRQLVTRLREQANVELRLLAADAKRLGGLAGRGVQVVIGDPADDDVLARALAGIDVAYFPIGLLGSGTEIARRLESFAERFRDACIAAGLRRIVYQGPSQELAARSRARVPIVDVGSVLGGRPDEIELVWLRAGFVLGRGSALFDVVDHLLRKFPLLAAPRWMDNPVGWVALDDIVHDLVIAARVRVRGSLVVDVGSAPASLRRILDVTARELGVRRLTFRVPVSLPRLSTWMVLLTTPLPYGLSGPFVSLLCAARDGVTPVAASASWLEARGRCYATLEAAIGDAIGTQVHEDASSHWSASLLDVASDEDDDDPHRARFRDVRRVDFGDLPASCVFQAVKSIGGREGWFRFNVLWQVRGLLDKLFGGLGTAIGRRAQDDLRVGDLLDVWRVIDLQPDRRLLLMAHMNVFGKAWLEFEIDGSTLTQTAYHLPEGLLGRLYWYVMLPFHAFIFPDMVVSIVRRAERTAGVAGAGTATRIAVEP